MMMMMVVVVVVVVMEEEEEDDDDDDDDAGGGGGGDGGGGGGPVKVKSSTKKAKSTPNTALKQGLGAPSFPDVSMTSGQIFRIRQALSTGIFPQDCSRPPPPKQVFDGKKMSQAFSCPSNILIRKYGF